MSNPTPTLLEDIDYYVEAGRWVFTAAYHRKRALTPTLQLRGQCGFGLPDLLCQ